MRYLLLSFIVAVPLFAQHDGPRSQPAAGDSPAARYMHDPAAIGQGRALFGDVCSGCHGPNGEGGRGPNLIDASNTRRAASAELFGWIQKGIPGTDMPPSPLPDESIWQLAAFVRNLGAPAFDQPLPGEPAAGREVFFGKAGCAKCHMIRGQGGLLGPDLSDAGASRKQVQLREAIVDPNKRISDGFTPVVVKLRDGKQIDGVARNFNNYSMQLMGTDGELHLLPKASIEGVVYRAESWMPSGYASRLTATELDDLVAFLSRQAIREPVREDPDSPRRENEDN